MNDADKSQATGQIDEIYGQLRRGLGHEHVTDDNVFALIERAERDGQSILAQELREWQSPCGGEDERPPSLFKPTAGFNKENVKH